MLDILASFAQNEVRTLLHVLCSILAAGTYYYFFCIIIGDPMQPTQPKLNERTVRKLIARFGRKSTEKYLQQYGKTISNYER